jgi:hypothetical protein
MVVSFPAGTAAVLKSAATLRGLAANFNSFLSAGGALLALAAKQGTDSKRDSRRFAANLSLLDKTGTCV